MLGITSKLKIKAYPHQNINVILAELTFSIRLSVLKKGYAVSMEGVMKRFGKVVALRNLSIKVPSGVIYGLIGPNGAGKTTTMRIIATLVKHDKGRVVVLGHELPKEKHLVRGGIAYLPEDAGLYHRLTGWENLLYFAMIYFDKGRKATEIASRGAEIAGLKKDDLKRKASEYSKGMARRIAIARALMIGAELVILDEPTSGLDVFSAFRIRKMIKQFVKETGTTVILSSHNMLEVEELCDIVALINKGQIIAEGPPDELKSKYGGRNLEETFISLVGEEYA